MTIFWTEGGSFCPMDKGFLQKEGTATLDIYRCPGCGNRYAAIADKSIAGEITNISEGFIKPKEIYRHSEKCTANPAAMTISMTIPAC